MAKDGSARAKSEQLWPMPKFYFEVKLDNDAMCFQEVSGLDAETQIIEYRAGNSPTFSTSKMPGIKKFGNVTMKKGLLANDKAFWKWFSEIETNTMKRKSITISLLDESGKPTMVWTLTNAFPTKITGTDLKADGNEVTVESVEVAHEGLLIANA